MWPPQRSGSLFQNAKASLFAFHTLFSVDILGNISRPVILMLLYCWWLRGCVWEPWELPLEATRPVIPGLQALHLLWAAGDGHSCCSQRLHWSCGFLSLLKICLLLPAWQAACFLLTGGWTRVGQGWDRQFWKAGLSDTNEILSRDDGGEQNTLLKGEAPKENSWSNGKALSERKFSAEYQEIFVTDFC